MIKFENPNGYIEITNAYFSTLVGRAAQLLFSRQKVARVCP